MTNRRHAHRYASPARTGGEDRPAPNCLDQWDAYDVLIDSHAGAEFRTALKAARSLCAECPIRAACWDANRDEPWVKALKHGKEDGPKRIRRKAEPTTRPSCGRLSGATLHYRHGEKLCGPCKEAERQRSAEKRAEKQAVVLSPQQVLHIAAEARKAAAARFTAARTEEVRHLIDRGAGITEACRVLDVSRDTFHKWCTRNGMRDAYEALAKRERMTSNQHAERGAA